MNGILGRVECNAKPRELLGYPFADTDRILADTGGEHECIDSLQGSSEHSRVETGAVDKVIDSERRLRILARFQFSHVVADAGQALQSAFAVEEILHVRSRHSSF